MGWDILGDVNDGWFAQLAHGAESVGRRVFGNGVYNNMGTAADNRVAAINQNAINQAVARGATSQQALQAGSAAMGQLTNPQNLSQLGNLVGTGGAVAATAVKDTIKNAVTPDLLGMLTPLLIGAGVLGGGYLLVDGLMDSKPSNRRSNRT